MILAYDKWACMYARKHVSSDNMAVDFYNFDLFFNLFVLLGFFCPNWRSYNFASQQGKFLNQRLC